MPLASGFHVYILDEEAKVYFLGRHSQIQSGMVCVPSSCDCQSAE